MLYSCIPAARQDAARKSARPRIVRDRKDRALRVDIHCHYLNPEVAQKLAPLDPKQHDALFRFSNTITREVNAKQVQERGPKLSSIETRLKDMDRMGIDIQAISPAPNQLAYWAEPDFGAEVARMVNDRLAEIVAKWPDRFVALGSIPLQNADLAVTELDRCVKELNLRGVEIIPNVNGKELSDPQLGLDKFFARAEDLGIVIFMHPLGFSQGERLSDHYFNNVIGNPLETTVAVSHLIFDGVIDRHPKLKIVLPHGGGYLAHYWARMDHAHRARPDCRTAIKRAPSSYLKKFYFDTITFDPRMLRQMLDQYGVDHVLLGTDYPYDMAEVDPVGLIAKIPRLARADRERIEGGNAARLLKIGRKK
ncbi:MAG: amidohydrolase family protein [Betaproteobacteria bacterium]